MNDIMNQAKAIKEDLISFRRTIHSNPEVGDMLPKTKSFVMEKLKEFGYEIADTHIYYLPDMDAPKIEEIHPVVWYDEKEIAAMKEENPFHNAFCYSPTQPDIIGVGAISDDGSIKGMAGASLDGKYVRQIGIDVKEEYRGEGLATYLTTLMKQKLLEKGTLPFYGTSESHSLSRSVAIKAGFLPAWCEIYVKKRGE